LIESKYIKKFKEININFEDKINNSSYYIRQISIHQKNSKEDDKDEVEEDKYLLFISDYNHKGFNEKLKLSLKSV
jgi:hypothetical protein